MDQLVIKILGIVAAILVFILVIVNDVGPTVVNKGEDVSNQITNTQLTP